MELVSADQCTQIENGSLATNHLFWSRIGFSPPLFNLHHEAREAKLTPGQHLKATIPIYKMRIKERRHRNTNPPWRVADWQQQFLGAHWMKLQVCWQQTGCLQLVMSGTEQRFMYLHSQIFLSSFVLELHEDMTKSLRKIAVQYFSWSEYS